MAITMNDLVFLGTELKLSVKIDPIGDYSMDDYDFEVEVYCSPKKTISCNKNQLIRMDKDNYIMLIDTEILGAGTIKAKITACIPDGDFEDGLRTEVKIIDTGINIVKTL